MSTDLDAALRSADPLAGVDDPAHRASLSAARMNVERRRRQVARPRWQRPLVLGAAVAATAAVALVTIDPGTSTPGRPGVRSGGLLPAAVAANGEIVSGGTTSSSYSAPVAPKDADLRLLPNDLPEGWSYEQILARVETEANWNVPASLVVVRQNPGGVTTGSLSVVGPIEATVNQEGTTADVVDGQDARLFVFDEPPADMKYATHIWWWTDEAGKQWQATTVDLSPEDARRAVEAVHTSGDQVSWQSPADLGLQVVHQRRGVAYPTERSGISWDLMLNDGQRDRPVNITRQDGPDPLPLVATTPGLQTTTVNGRPAVLFPVGEMKEDAEIAQRSAAGLATCRWMTYQVESGVQAMTETCGDEAKVASMLASLVNVPPTDPRLTKYASDE